MKRLWWQEWWSLKYWNTKSVCRKTNAQLWCQLFSLNLAKMVNRVSLNATTWTFSHLFPWKISAAVARELEMTSGVGRIQKQRRNMLLLDAQMEPHLWMWLILRNLLCLVFWKLALLQANGETLRWSGFDYNNIVVHVLYVFNTLDNSY